MRKRFFIPLAAVAAAGLAGGAFAAGQTTNSNPQQAFINDAARRLHVTPDQLTSAFRQALIDRIKAAQAAGRLSHAQANSIEQRIQHSSGLPFGPGPFLFGPGGAACGPGPMSIRAFGPPGAFGPPRAFGPPGAEVPVFGPPAILSGAAGYLHLSQTQLRKELNAGKTLAQIAQAQGKTRRGLERALIATATSQLEKGVKTRRLPRRLERRLLIVSAAQIQRLVDASWKFADGHGFAIAVKARGGPPPAFPGPWLAMMPPCQIHARVQQVHP